MTPQNKHKKLPKNAAKIADAFQHYGYKQGYSEGFKAGKRSILEEMKHEQRKLLDGFGHPKDCEFCSLSKEEEPNNPQDE